MTRWTAQTFGAPTRLKPKAVDALAPSVTYDPGSGRTKAVFEVSAATLRQATDAALRRARELLPVKPAEIIVQTTERYRAEAEQPPAMDLLSLGDAAELLGVSATRVMQLWESRRNDFPAPLARPRTGPIWTRASLEAFQHRRDRAQHQAGRPPKAARRSVGD